MGPEAGPAEPRADPGLAPGHEALAATEDALGCHALVPGGPALRDWASNLKGILTWTSKVMIQTRHLGTAVPSPIAGGLPGFGSSV